MTECCKQKDQYMQMFGGHQTTVWECEVKARTKRARWGLEDEAGGKVSFHSLTFVIRRVFQN